MLTFITLALGCLTLTTLARPEENASRDMSVKSKTDRPCLKYDVNGCSVPFGLPFYYKDQFTPSCDRHDVCYSCGVAYAFTKNACDLAFRNDTLATCRFKYLPFDPTDQALLVLKATKELGFEGVQILLSENMPRFTIVLPYPGLQEFNNWFASHANQVRLLAAWVMKVSIYTHHLVEHSNSKEREIKALPYPESDQQKIEAIISKLKQHSNDLTFEAESLLRPSTQDVKALCTEVLDYLAARGQTPIVAGAPLGCDVASYILCDFYSEVYYLAVAIFGMFGYRTDAAFYCHEAWVRGCLPKY